MKLPEWVVNTMRILFRIPIIKDNDEWKRYRIAVTKAEMDEYKTSAPKPFVRALKGIPLIIEDDPKNYPFYVEED